MTYDLSRKMRCRAVNRKHVSRSDIVNWHGKVGLLAEKSMNNPRLCSWYFSSHEAVREMQHAKKLELGQILSKFILWSNNSHSTTICVSYAANTPLPSESRPKICHLRPQRTSQQLASNTISMYQTSLQTPPKNHCPFIHNFIPPHIRSSVLSNAALNQDTPQNHQRN